LTSQIFIILYYFSYKKKKKTSNCTAMPPACLHQVSSCHRRQYRTWDQDADPNV